MLEEFVMLLTPQEIYNIADKAENVTKSSNVRVAHQKAIENAIREALSLQLSRLITLVPAQVPVNVAGLQIDLNKH